MRHFFAPLFLLCLICTFESSASSPEVVLKMKVRQLIMLNVAENDSISDLSLGAYLLENKSTQVYNYTKNKIRKGAYSQPLIGILNGLNDIPSLHNVYSNENYKTNYSFIESFFRSHVNAGVNFIVDQNALSGSDCDNGQLDNFILDQQKIKGIYRVLDQRNLIPSTRDLESAPPYSGYLNFQENQSPPLIPDLEQMNAQGELKLFYFPSYEKPDSIKILNAIANGNFLVLDDKVDLFVDYILEMIRIKMLSEEIVDQRISANWNFKKKSHAQAQTYGLDLSPSLIEQNLYYNLCASNICLLDNQSGNLPLTLEEKSDCKLAIIGKNQLVNFRPAFNDYGNVSSVNYILEDSKKIVEHLNGSTNILLIEPTILYAAYDEEHINRITEHLNKTNSIVIIVGDPDLSLSFKGAASIHCADLSKYNQISLANSICGMTPFKGKIGFKHPSYPCRHSTINSSRNVINQEFKNSQSFRSAYMENIDKLVNDAIDKGALPGAQICVLKDGKLLLQKNYGYHTYNRERRVHENDLYDLASMTKILSPTLLAMHFYDKNKLALDKRVKDYLFETEDLPIGQVKISDLLTHYSGIQAFMPVFDYMNSYGDTSYLKYFTSDYDKGHPIKIADSFFFETEASEQIWENIKNLKIERKRYRYSDVNMNILKKVLEEIGQKPLNELVDSLFYSPLNLSTITYRPRDKFDKEIIAPTQDDKIWREQLLQGYVHDYASALMNGVSGSAGLFSDSYDIAVIMQMILNGGTYGGTRFIDQSTVVKFTRSQKPNHRGLGYNKPRRSKRTYAASQLADVGTFGHTGFTGTCTWVDPKNKLVFVFLSNRVHPEENNKLINQLKLRQKVFVEVQRGCL